MTQLADLKELARAYGTGAFKKRTWTRKDGSIGKCWRGYVYASDGHLCYGSGKTQKAAEAKAEAARLKYERSKFIPQTAQTPIPTLEEWTNQYIERKRQEKKRLATAQKYADLQKHLIGFIPKGERARLGSFPLDKLEYRHLEEFITWFRRSNSDNYAHLMQTWIRTTLQNAVDHELITVNRARRLPSIKRKKKSLGIDDDGFARLMHGATNDRMRAFLCLAYMGCRISEIIGVTADCIQGNSVEIRQQLQRVVNPDNPNNDDASKPETIIALTELKTDESRRLLTLTDDVMKILMSSLDHAKPTKIYNDMTGKWETVLFVVPNQNGNAWQQHNLRLQFARLCRDAGVNTHPHELRAMCVTDLIDDEHTSSKLTSLVVGHSSTQVTEDFYHRVRRDQIAPVTMKRSKRMMSLVALVEVKED